MVRVYALTVWDFGGAGDDVRLQMTADYDGDSSGDLQR
jgi:hypothetical protein